MDIEIRTLGHFSVRSGSTILSEEANKSKKLWELFKFFVTYRGKSLLPETIQETLWPDSDFEYSERAFRTLVYRLRQVLKKGLPADKEMNPIVFAHGCYHWNTKINYWLDLEELEKNYTMARKHQESHPEKALTHYRLIFELYQGSYLQESLYTEWTISTRNYYRHLYLQAMKNYLKLLISYERDSEMIEVCERIILLEPIEEEFYIYLIGALLRQEKMLEARANYERITSLLYKELGVKPSAEMRKLYTLLKAEGESVDSPGESLKFQASRKAFFCDKSTFKSICELEHRKAERTSEPVLVVSLNLKFREEMQDPLQLKRALNQLKGILDTNLRRGDVYTLWSDSQIALILNGLNVAFTNKVMNRIENAFRKFYPDDSVSLHFQYETLNPQLMLTN